MQLEDRKNNVNVASLDELVANSEGEDIYTDLAFDRNKLATDGEICISYIIIWGIDGVWR